MPRNIGETACFDPTTPGSCPPDTDAQAHSGDPVARVSELAALAGPSRLRDYEVPRKDLPELAQAIAERPAAKANPAPGAAGRSARAARGDVVIRIGAR